MERYDCHCHIFNIVDVGLKAILEELNSAKELLDQQNVNSKQKTKETDNDEEKASIWEKLRKIAEMIKIFTGDSETILETLDKHYDGKYTMFPLMFDGDFLLDDFDDEELGFVKELATISKQPEKVNNSNLAKELKEDSSDDSDVILRFLGQIEDLVEERKSNNEYKSGFQKQYDQIKAIKAQEKYADKVLPFLGVDPRNKTIKNYLTEIGANQTFAGVKVYPPNGFSPCDPILVGEGSIFEYCSQNQIPIISHCSYGGFATPVMSIDVDGMIIPEGKTKPEYHNGEYTFTRNIKDGFTEMVRERAGVLNHPLIWEEVLKQYPNLILVLAHFGVGSDSWQQEILRLMKIYPNLHTDVSCISETDKLEKIKSIHTENPDIAHKILYGSDYYLDMFFNDSFDDYLERMQRVFGEELFNQLSSENPKLFMQKWYQPVDTPMETIA
ncbi:hypothetical protein EMN47_16775 [Prolixibacteraceae bacterium JC049]|nr:hypothetical protein [Prolixibacteraceae bacterium JC049]